MNQIVSLQGENFLEIGIRYGLYLGAIFQILCLAGIILLHDKFDSCKMDDSDDSSSQSSPQNTPKQRNHRNKKDNKKKRR